MAELDYRTRQACFFTNCRAESRALPAEWRNSRFRTARFVFLNSLSHMFHRRVEVNSSEVTLTPTEFDLLALMAQSPERVFTRELLMNKIWGYDYYGDGHIIDVHISALRKKIEASTDYRYIKTVWRIGYKFEVGARTAVS